MVNLFLASILLPLFAIFLLARRVREPFAGWFSTFFFATGLTAFSFFAAPWGWFGVPARWVLLLAYVAAFVMSVRRPVPEELPREGVLRIVTKLLIGVLFGMVGFGALQGRVEPEGTVDVEFPLRKGTYLVGHGGSSLPSNHHFAHPSQRYAVDILKLNAIGRRANGFAPSDVREYAIWDAAVHSPCDGVVAAAVDGLPDRVPPNRDEKNLAGNHVSIRCKGVVIYLAHLRRGSVSVRPGAQVRAGQPIARAGNSGNTTEPHLHIHAERGGRAVNTAPGVGLTFGGRWLVRNSVVRQP